MKTVKNFPRNFRTSSAALRAVRQYCQKMDLKCGESGLVMTKLGVKYFIVSGSVKMSVEEFNKNHPNVSYPSSYVKSEDGGIISSTDKTFRYFPDGTSGAGYYELKTGERRRPNSVFLNSDMVYSDYIFEDCK